MMTIRQIERLWNMKSYQRLSRDLLAARQEVAFGVEGLDRPCAVAALAIIRMDELAQSHLPFYGQLVRVVLAAQDRDGGWGDPAATALCVRALLLGHGDGAAIVSGLGYLATLQKDDGIWPAGPLRRMGADPAVSLFILYELGANPRFQAAVRFADALEWFGRNGSVLSAECRSLCERTRLRCRSFQPGEPVNAAPALFAA